MRCVRRIANWRCSAATRCPRPNFNPRWVPCGGNKPLIAPLVRGLRVVQNSWVVKLSVIDQSPVSEGSTPADALRNTIELAKLADRLGYERYWMAEHHGMGTLASPAPE